MNTLCILCDISWQLCLASLASSPLAGANKPLPGACINRCIADHDIALHHLHFIVCIISSPVLSFPCNAEDAECISRAPGLYQEVSRVQVKFAARMTPPALYVCFPCCKQQHDYVASKMSSVQPATKLRGLPSTKHMSLPGTGAIYNFVHFPSLLQP
jgi:hypothetical protein